MKEVLTNTSYTKELCHKAIRDNRDNYGSVLFVIPDKLFMKKGITIIRTLVQMGLVVLRNLFTIIIVNPVLI